MKNKTTQKTVKKAFKNMQLTKQKLHIIKGGDQDLETIVK